MNDKDHSKSISGDGFTCIPQFESSNQAGKYSESGEAGAVNYGGDRAEEFDGALGQYSFDGQFDGSNRFEYGQGANNGDIFYGMGDYDYSTGWGNSDYFGETGMTMVIDSSGKIGVNKPKANGAVHNTADATVADRYVQTDNTLIHTSSTSQIDKESSPATHTGLSQALHDVKQVSSGHPYYDEDNLTRYWSFMHRLWGQASANQREFIDPIGSEVGASTTFSQLDFQEDKPGAQNANPNTGAALDGIAESYMLNGQVSDNAAVAGTTLYPSRWYGYHENNHDVTNNLSAGKESERLAGRFIGGLDSNPLYDIMESKRGRHGKTLYDFHGGFTKGNSGTEGVRIANEPWDILNSHNRHTFEDTTNGRTADAWDATWGFTQGNIKIDADATHTSGVTDLPVFGDMGKNVDEQIFADSGFFDSSWELGKPLLGAHVDPRGELHLQQDQRWFEGINSSPADTQPSVGSISTSEPNDDAKMRCFHCEIQYGLHWNPVDKHFYTRDVRQTANAATGTDAVGYGAWGDCEREGESRTCEYSSGVCFVEERRTFGYITLVRKGCKQAQACYMQKYQNFLVQAGRQCWPADGSDSSMKVAARPNDVMADQWIYNLVSGGNPYEYTLDGQWNDFMDVHWPLDSNGSNPTIPRNTNNIASTFDFKYNKFNEGDNYLYSRDEFDNTFVDVDRDGQVTAVEDHLVGSGFTAMKEIHGPTFGFYKDPMAITQLPHDTSVPPIVNANYWGNAYKSAATFPFVAHPATDLTPASGTRTYTNPVPATVIIFFCKYYISLLPMWQLVNPYL